MTRLKKTAVDSTVADSHYKVLKMKNFRNLNSDAIASPDRFLV